MASTALKGYQSAGLNDLSDKEFRFVENYVIHLNGQQAAVEAGYKASSARTLAARLLSRTRVRRAIGVLKRRGLKRAELTQQEVLQQLRHCVTRTSDDYLDDDGKLLPHDQWNDRAKAALDGIKQRTRILKDSDGNVIGEEVETEVRLVSKGGAITTALKHFSEQVTSDENVAAIDWDAMYNEQTDSASTALRALEMREGNDE